MGVGKFAGVVIGVPLAGFVGTVSLQVYRSQRAEREIEERVIAELVQAQQAQQAAKREEAAIAGLEQTVQLHQKGVQQIEVEIEGVQQKLTELRELRDMRIKEQADAAGALEEAQGKLARMVQEARRHRQAATMAEQALAAAHRETVQAKQVFANPLQHPLLKTFASRH